MTNNPASTFQRAKIYESDKNGKSIKEVEVECAFNPYEYRVSKSNNYTPKPVNNSDTQEANFTSSGPQTLTLSLIFDAYILTGKDIIVESRNLWKFMSTKKGSRKDKKASPPYVVFEWGVFKFVAVITQMTQSFTLFDPDGRPLRVKVDVTFAQYIDRDDFHDQDAVPSHTTYEQARRVIVGDRLDTIAAEIYGDASQWRRIADYNHITNPLALRPGQELRIPIT